MYVRRLVTAIALLALTACSGLGPIRSEDAETHVTKVVPAGDGPIEQWSAAEWSPDLRGAPSFTERLGGINFRQGVFILTPVSALFAQWDDAEARYRILLRIPYSEMQDSEIMTYGRNRLLVLTEKNYRTHTFLLAGKWGAMVDVEASERAAKYIASRRESK